MEFGFDLPRVWRRRSLKMVDGQWTDDGACLYYKLTNEPKGSGELKMHNQNSKPTRNNIFLE